MSKQFRETTINLPIALLIYILTLGFFIVLIHEMKRIMASFRPTFSAYQPVINVNPDKTNGTEVETSSCGGISAASTVAIDDQELSPSTRTPFRIDRRSHLHEPSERTSSFGSFRQAFPEINRRSPISPLYASPLRSPNVSTFEFSVIPPSEP